MELCKKKKKLTKMNEKKKIVTLVDKLYHFNSVPTFSLFNIYTFTRLYIHIYTYIDIYIAALQLGHFHQRV